MATRSVPVRLALREVRDRTVPDGAWWPESRILDDQLGQLFALWPSAAGRIVRVLYSPPDWADHPRSVAVARGRVKTGSFPQDDTHQLVLSMLGGDSRTITVIPPETPTEVASALLRDVDGRPADAAGRAPDQQ